MSIELDRGVGFIVLPVLLAVGALIYFSLGHEPGFLPLAAGTVGLGVLAFASRVRPALHMALVAALLCVLGAFVAKAETWRAGTKMLGGEVTTRLSGRVVEAEHLANGRVRLTIDVTGTERPVLRYAPDRVRVSARRVPEGVTAGSAVTGLVRLMPPSGPVRPGSYDFSFESYFDGIGASGFFLRGPELTEASGTMPPLAAFQAAVERFRHDVARRISGRIGGPEGEIAAALVVGVRAGIPEDVKDALRRSGIYHVISISGLHMALVAGTIMGLLRAGFALFPDFSSRRSVKKYAAALAIVGLAGYLFISGAEVAAQRSFIMLAIMLTAVLFDRAALTLRNLAIAAIVVILLSPHEVVGPSFQMSFAATAALVGAYAAWSDWRADHPGQAQANRSLARRAVRYLLLAAAGLAVTSIVAGGATAIYAAWHFQQMPSLGLFTNLAAMPIVSAVVMPFAVLGALAMPFGLDGPFFDVMGLGLGATIAIARWFSERSPTDMVGLVPPASVAILTIALLIATICSTWLRIAAVPVALAGLLLLFDQPRPDLFIAEDGRLVGLGLGHGRIAVNRSRPNEFTIDNWKRALRASEVVRPEGKQERVAAAKPSETADGKLAAEQQHPLTVSVLRTSPPLPLPGGEEPPIAGVATSQKLGSSPPQSGREVARAKPETVREDFALCDDPVNCPESASLLQRPTTDGFVCADALCLARHPSGAIVAHALDAEAAMDVCATASVIVIDDAAAKGVCRWKDVLVVTKRDLALNSSAAITFSGEAIGEAPRVAATIEYAISRPFRPWHEQRRFSREARGLAPYRRPDKPATPTKGAPDSPSLGPDPASPTESADPKDAQ
ncbi:ComEC/Rec2 family competence protein [Mesorhizobium sp. KR9-304]|uniref:ComEC/Rec2 family competence protein n=1 Tax=Mesorhizobium sp. KR9-304 TaxID=3156614 RepID=UPI0032B4E487